MLCITAVVYHYCSVLSVQTRTRPLEVGQYVRLKRAPYKDDLAKVHDIINHGEKVMYY
jgi:hypothetical protein